MQKQMFDAFVCHRINESSQLGPKPRRRYGLMGPNTFHVIACSRADSEYTMRTYQRCVSTAGAIFAGCKLVIGSCLFDCGTATVVRGLGPFPLSDLPAGQLPNLTLDRKKYRRDTP